MSDPCAKPDLQGQQNSRAENAGQVASGASYLTFPLFRLIRLIQLLFIYFYLPSGVHLELT